MGRMANSESTKRSQLNANNRTAMLREAAAVQLREAAKGTLILDGWLGATS